MVGNLRQDTPTGFPMHRGKSCELLIPLRRDSTKNKQLSSRANTEQGLLMMCVLSQGPDDVASLSGPVLFFF